MRYMTPNRRYLGLPNKWGIPHNGNFHWGYTQCSNKPTLARTATKDRNLKMGESMDGLVSNGNSTGNHVFHRKRPRRGYLQIVGCVPAKFPFHIYICIFIQVRIRVFFIFYFYHCHHLYHLCM
jgi:hypothetical protein